MSQMTDYMENALADMVRGQGLTLPTNWYVGLASAGADGSFTELSGTGYARQALARSLTNWAGTQGAGTVLVSSGTSHATSNNVAVDFGTSGAAWGTANDWLLFDDETAGNCWVVGELDTPQVIGSGAPVELAIAAMAVTLGISGGVSNYLANKLIDKIFRGETYNWPATTYVAYTTELPTNAAVGDEPLGGYARVAVSSALTSWSATQGGTSASSGTGGQISNLAAIVFPLPTADQGDIVGHMLMDASTLGNMLLHGAMLADDVPSAFTVNVGGDAPRWEAGQYLITFA